MKNKKYTDIDELDQDENKFIKDADLKSKGKSGRPKKTNRDKLVNEQMFFYSTKEEKEKIIEAAEEADLSQSKFIRKIIKEYFSK